MDVFPEFEGEVYSGKGIVQDGNVNTSGAYPLWSRDEGLKDGTLELTYVLIEAMKAKQ